MPISVSSAPRHSSERRRSSANAQVALERRQAIRALLMEPLLPAGGSNAETWRLIRRHQEYLQAWFAHWPGWTLRVQPGLARLEKTTSSDEDTTRGAVDPGSRVPFTRRRYALLCLTLSVLCHQERQTTLRSLAEQLQTQVRLDRRLAAAGFELDLRILAHRRDLISVMRLLAELRILTRLDGDDGQFLRGDGDCLYRVDHAMASVTLSISHGPSLIDADDLRSRIEGIHAAARSDRDGPGPRELQYRLVRRLLDDAVVYVDDLTEHEIEYFRHQRHRLISELEEATGLVAEVRAEGVALLDADGDLSDFRLPEQGTRGHAVLLIAEWLSDRGRNGVLPEVTVTELTEYVQQLAQEHHSHWRKGVQDADGVEQLTQEILRILESLQLVLRRGQRVIPLPALARYRLTPGSDEQTTPDRQRSLL